MTKKILCVASPHTTFIPAYFRRNWGINKATVSRVQSFYQQQARCISRSLARGPKRQRDNSKMFNRECCLPHRSSAVLLLVIYSHSESTGRKVDRGVRCPPPWNSLVKMQQGQLWSALPCVRMFEGTLLNAAPHAKFISLRCPSSIF